MCVYIYTTDCPVTGSVVSHRRRQHHLGEVRYIYIDINIYK